MVKLVQRKTVETESGRGQLRVTLTALVRLKSRETGKATLTLQTICPAKSGIAAEANRQNNLCQSTNTKCLMAGL